MHSTTSRRHPGTAFAAAAAACALALTAVVIASPPAARAAVVTSPIVHSAADAAISLTPIGSYDAGVFDKSAAEIVAYHGDRLFVVNAQAGVVDVLDFSDPTAIAKVGTIPVGGIANSVAIRADGLGIIAVENTVKTEPGSLAFFDATATTPGALGTVTVGALPDNVAITPDGRYAVVANEGEPDAETFTTDPEGSVGIVALPEKIAAPAQDAVRTADFHQFEEGGTKTLHPDVRVFGPTPHGDDKPVSRNLEPEYIAIDGSGTVAYAALQEANAVAVVDIATATVTDIWPLGFKDHSVAGNGIDPSDRDPRDAPEFDIRTFPGLKGIYMPDGIASYQAGDKTFLVTANEGDAREWGDYVEAVRVKDLAKDGFGPVNAERFAGLLGDDQLGRLNVTIENGFNAETGQYDELYAFGGRSFSIWTTDGEQVFDSGEDFERITNAAGPDFFNSNHSESNLEGRSDDKGPEPENLTIGQVDGRTYAFIGLERVGGVMVYDITDPADASFVTYINNRDFSISGAGGGDLGPEGLSFIPASASPTGKPLVAVANEVSGTTTLFEVTTTETTVQLLTVNDFHGRVEAGFANGEAGAAVLAGAVDHFEALNPNTLFVSSGDNIGASTFTSFIADDEPTINALREAGLDLGAVGNHEFDQGFADLTDRVNPLYGGTQFGLGANVYDKGTKDPALDEYVVEVVDGVRVAFIGTVTPDTANMVTPTGIASIEFGDQLEAANRVAADITAGDLADVIVLLTHDGSATPDQAAGLAATSDFAALVKGASAEIDAIVSGHTHQSYTWNAPVPGVQGKTRPVIQAHQYGTTLGKLDVTVDTASKELVSIEGSLVDLVEGTGATAKPNFEADPAVAAIVADAVEIAEELGSVPVGEISADILRGKTATGAEDRGVESTLGNLVADVYLWATSNDSYAGVPAEIGIMNPGGLRADLLYGTDGELTVRDVANVQPFANTLVTVTLTGAQLTKVLEEQWQPAGSSRPKLHLGISDGLTYEYDPAAAAGSRIVSVSFEGKPVKPADEFTVVTNSFLAAGGDNFATFAAGTARTDTGQIDLTATVEYFEAHDVVDPAPLGRAAVAGDGGGEEPQPGTAWATVELGSGSVEQGGTLPVKISGLKPGQQIRATLFSDPIVVSGIPAADAEGRTAFSVRIPADLTVGAHTLVIESEGLEPIRTEVKVVAAGSLAVTGAEAPWGFATVAALLLLAGGALVLMKRRRATA